MSEYTIENLEEQLEQLINSDLPAQAAHDIHAALQVADILESSGYDFKLKDLCPASLCDTGWRAVFRKNDASFAAENPDAAVAVCAAAVAAMTNSDST